MTTLTNRRAGRGLADRLVAAGKAIFEQSDVAHSAEGAGDPQVVALTLLVSTLGHFKSGILLLEADHIVEARTMARCCYENLFWIASLATTNSDFIKAIQLDDAASRMKRAHDLREWLRVQDKESDFAKTLDGLCVSLKAKHGRPEPITHKKAANDGGVGNAYILYQELSSDAAHPSATSLRRQISWDGDGDYSRFTLHARPIDEPFAAEDALELMCSPFLGVCVAAKLTLRLPDGCFPSFSMIF